MYWHCIPNLSNEQNRQVYNQNRCGLAFITTSHTSRSYVPGDTQNLQALQSISTMCITASRNHWAQIRTIIASTPMVCTPMVWITFIVCKKCLLEPHEEIIHNNGRLQKTGFLKDGQPGNGVLLQDSLSRRSFPGSSQRLLIYNIWGSTSRHYSHQMSANMNTTFKWKVRLVTSWLSSDEELIDLEPSVSTGTQCRIKSETQSGAEHTTVEIASRGLFEFLLRHMKSFQSIESIRHECY